MCTYHIYSQCSLPHGAGPYCGCVSHSVHSRYHRTITDLSILGHPVVITFEVRKFFCHNPNCRRKTFAEQHGDEVFRYRRRTRRYEMALVSRDRSTDYTAAIAATGRNITEAADRFHLNMNMSKCVKKVIGLHYDDTEVL